MIDLLVSTALFHFFHIKISFLTKGRFFEKFRKKLSGYLFLKFFEGMKSLLEHKT